MDYIFFSIFLFTISLVLFIISLNKVKNDDHPVPIILFVLLIITAIFPWFSQGWLFDFDEPVCIEHIGYVETEYSWKHQEKTFEHNGETHQFKELLDHKQLNPDSFPDSIMVFKYIYKDFGFIKPSKEYFVYSEKSTKYTQEGACKTSVQTK